MPAFLLGAHPEALTIRLVLGDGASLYATSEDGTWPAAPTLELAPLDEGEPVALSLLATLSDADTTATWVLTEAQVTALHATADAADPKLGQARLRARITIPDDGDGTVTNAGRAHWVSAWQPGASRPVATYTVAGPAGPAGPPGESGAVGGGSSSLTVVAGGTVDLDDTKADGYLIGYKVTATTTIEGVSFAAGSYIFERDSTVGTGWTYRTIDAGSEVVVVVITDTTAPTAPTLTVDNSAETQLVATFSGGTDAVGVTQYRTRIGGGTWTVGTSPRTFTGLTAGTSYTIDAQAGDAAGNWSTSGTWTGSTAAADPAPGWTVFDDFTAADATVLNGRTTVKGAKTWTSPNSYDGGGVPEAAIVTGNLVANANASGLSTQGARISMPAGDVEVEVNYDVSAGVDGTANKQVIVHVASASSTDFLAFQVRAGGALVCLKGGAVEPVMSGVKTGLPSTGTVNVKLVGTTVTITHPAGVATVTVVPGAAPGWTNTGTWCGVSARSRTAKFDSFKAR